MKYVLTALALALAVSTGYADTRRVVSDDNNYVWVENDDNEKLEIRIHGSVELTDDSTGIARMKPGSSLYAEQRSGGTTRSVSVKPSGGDFAYEYKVDGHAEAFDAEARSWLAGLLKRAVEEGGFNMEAHARRVLAERGPAGVFEMIERAKSDYAKAAMLDILLESARPDADTARRALEVAGHRMDSDYYKQHVISRLAGEPLSDPETRAAFFAAYATIDSDYYRAEALGDAIERHANDAGLLRAAAEAAGSIGSDYYIAETLGKLADHARDDAALRDAIVEAAKKIGSDYYRGQVLAKLYR
jgi:hypothetical protein